MKKIIKQIIQNPIKAFLVVLLIQVLALANMKIPKIDGSFDSIGIADKGYLTKLKQIDSVFKHEQLIFIEIVPKSVAIGKVLEDCEKIDKSIRHQLKNTTVTSIHTAGKLFFSSQTQKGRNSIEILEKLAKITIFKEIISKDKRSFLLLVNVVDEDKNQDFANSIDKVLAQEYPSISTFYVVSPWHIEKEITKTITSDLKHMTLWILLAFSLLVLLFYRSYRAVIYIVINMLFTMIPTLLLLSIYGYNLNMIIVLIIPIVSILALADSIHILTGYLASDKTSFNERITATYQKYIIPSFLTSLTTALAFYSLFFNSTESIAMLGVITGHIVLISFVLCYLASPLLLKILRPKGEIRQILFVIPTWLEKHQKPISIVLIGLFVVAIFLYGSLSYKNNFEIFLPKNAKVTADHDTIKAHFYSQSTVDVMLTFRKKDQDIDIPKQIKVLTHQFKKLDHVRLVKSSRNLKSLKLLTNTRLSNPYETNSGLIQLINLKVDNPNSIKAIEEKLIDLLEKNTAYDFVISSPTLVFNEVNDAVSKSLMQSVVVSILLLLLIFILLTKSFLKGVIGIFVNIIPLAFIVLIFVVFGFHINMLTAITGVVSIGLIVDDTIHVFYRRMLLKQEQQQELSIGIIATTLILFVSFISFTLSDFVPTKTFGLIAAIVFLVALISDLALLPYLLKLFIKENGKNR